MKSTIDASTTVAKEYRWKGDGADGLRSYSYNASNHDWNYSEIENPNKAENEAYTFSDSSTGQPSARRGNLYNLTAATLGSSLGVEAKGEQAPDSICPRGWQLPTITTNLAESASATEMTDKSFSKLLRAYEIAQINGKNLAGVNRTREQPLEYLPTGRYVYSYGYVINRTTISNWWSSVITSAANGYNLFSSSDEIGTQGNWGRGGGFALRCVARQLLPPKSTPP